MDTTVDSNGLNRGLKQSMTSKIKDLQKSTSKRSITSWIGPLSLNIRSEFADQPLNCSECAKNEHLGASMMPKPIGC